MIVQGTTAFVQGQRYQGEVLMNCVALSASVDGPILFIFKPQDLYAMPQQKADLIASLIVAVDRHLPKVTRGQQATQLNGYMKCALDRHSCCAGDFGKTKAERDDPAVANQILRILKEEVASLRLAFPMAMLDIYNRCYCNRCMPDFLCWKVNVATHVFGYTAHQVSMHKLEWYNAINSHHHHPTAPLSICVL